MSDEFLIGELARMAQVTQRTIRYYETLGLLQPSRHADSKYRYYSAADLERLQKITRMNQAGLSLDEIAEIIDLMDGSPAGESQGKRKLLAILEQRLEEVDQKIDTLQQFQSELQETISQLRDYLDEAE